MENAYCFSDAEMELFRRSFKNLAYVFGATPPDLQLEVLEGSDPITLKQALGRIAEDLLEFHRIGCDRTAAANALYGPRPDTKP